MKRLFDIISDKSAIVITKEYSTSFSIAVRLLSPSIRQAIYNIYGFVRIADEIVDSFTDYPQRDLFERFVDEYRSSMEFGISSNPVIHAFQQTMNQYYIDHSLVDAFLKSMEMDLTKTVYSTQEEMEEYIYGSADVVGLMCLKVFVKGDQKEYERLRIPAMKLGSAFQKVNFIRDLKQDFDQLHRTYFPNVDPNNFDLEDKNKIVEEIHRDFEDAYLGIKELPKEARFGVYVAYKYYLQLLRKVERTPALVLKEKRISVSNYFKTLLLCQSYIYYKLNLV